MVNVVGLIPACPWNISDIDDCQSFADAARKNLHFEVQEFVGDGGGIGITQSSEILVSEQVGPLSRNYSCNEW